MKKYLLVIDGFGRFVDFSKHARVFNSEQKARKHVAAIHDESWDAEKECFKDGVEWDTALLYLIEKDGALTLVDEYDTTANETGYATGWIGPNSDN